jgi:hypothetical protein
MPMKMDSSASAINLVASSGGSAAAAAAAAAADKSAARGGLALSVEYCVVCGDRASGNSRFDNAA